METADRPRRRWRKATVKPGMLGVVADAGRCHHRQHTQGSRSAIFSTKIELLMKASLPMSVRPRTALRFSLAMYSVRVQRDQLIVILKLAVDSPGN